MGTTKKKPVRRPTRSARPPRRNPEDVIRLRFAKYDVVKVRGHWEVNDKRDSGEIVMLSADDSRDTIIRALIDADILDPQVDPKMVGLDDENWPTVIITDRRTGRPFGELAPDWRQTRK